MFWKKHRTSAPSPPSGDAITEKGRQILQMARGAGRPAFFSRRSIYGPLVEWTFKDEAFRTQLFRFVDLLPGLDDDQEVIRHLKEYLGEVRLPAALRAALAMSGAAGSLGAGTIRANVSAMARQFMIPEDPEALLQALRDLHRQDIAFTVDLLGERVVSESEAEHYAGRYLRLLDNLHGQFADWEPCAADRSPRGPLPILNVSLKISALYSQITPADPEGAIEALKQRLRPILRRAGDYGAFINFDMESYELKDLTIALFKSVFSEAEFAQRPAAGIALQTYLRDSEEDVRGIIRWARRQNRPLTVRLVKGAYWDYETILARQKNWTPPVFQQKAESDLQFEKLARILLDHEDLIHAAFGTHNARSIAAALAHAEKLGLDPRSFEIQMIYGMAEPIRKALLDLGCRMRLYTPVGELLPGMAYLVRRLLENTSNEGFLVGAFSQDLPDEALLADPQSAIRSKPAARDEPRIFVNEPPADFTREPVRRDFTEALRRCRAGFGERLPLVIGEREVDTGAWLESCNPANPQEIVGYAARAGRREAEMAVEAAVAARADWSRRPAPERAGLIERLGELMARDRVSLAALEVLEVGKNWMEADADVTEAIDFCRYYAAQMRHLAEPAETQRVSGEINRQHWIPRGVAAVIAPWNFPLAILTGMTAAAAVAGNTVIVKPAEQSPVIAARLMALAREAGLPPGVINFLPGLGEEVGAYLVEHPKVDLIAFTGSKEVGLAIWEAAGRMRSGQANLKKVICEMGGKNALIIDASADFDDAVLGALASAFGYQGQKCSALSRLIVLRPAYRKFVDRLVTAARSLEIGPPEEAGHAIGPVIDAESRDRLLRAVAEAQSGAKLLFQAGLPELPGLYVPPAIFGDVVPESLLFRRELFGPVLGVTAADSMDEAIALANDSEYALTGGIFSRTPSHIERAKRELRAGNIYINRSITGAIVQRQPFGGFALSGGGTKAGGPDYLQHFLFPRTFTENRMRHGFAPLEEG